MANVAAAESSASKKHKQFVDESIIKKDVKMIPGIGEVAAKKLGDAGFKEASKVVGQFLVLDMDEGKFKKWLWKTCNAQAHCQAECFKAIKEWTDNHL